ARNAGSPIPSSRPGPRASPPCSHRTPPRRSDALPPDTRAPRSRRPSARFSFAVLLDQIPIEKPIGERHALVLEQLLLRIDLPLQRHLDRPRARVGVRVVERRFVGDVIPVEESEPLGDGALIARV